MGSCQALETENREERNFPGGEVSCVTLYRRQVSPSDSLVYVHDA